MWFIGVEVEQETSAPPPKKNPGSAPVSCNEKTDNDSNMSCNYKVKTHRRIHVRYKGVLPSALPSYRVKVV